MEDMWRRIWSHAGTMSLLLHGGNTHVIPNRSKGLRSLRSTQMIPTDSLRHSRAVMPFQRLHVEGTRSAVTAAEREHVKKFVLVSYLNVRPNVKSEYHRTKWQGEEIVRRGRTNLSSVRDLLDYAKHRERVLSGTLKLGVIPSMQ